MEKDKSAINEQILCHIMEILYLLTGEDYIIVKKPGRQATNNKRLLVVEGISRTLGNVVLTPPQSVTSQERNNQKIRNLTNKITELLNGEVPIRCEDVTLHFSMEEWEYVEGHKDLYTDVLIKKQQSLEILDDTISKNSLLHNETSDLLIENVMSLQTESGTESLKIHNPGVKENLARATKNEKISACEDGNISNVDHTNYSSMHIKDEPCDDSYKGGTFPIPHSTSQFPSVPIKKEADSYDGGHLKRSISCTSRDVTQPHPDTVEEQSSYESPQPNMNTPTDHTQHHPQPNIYTPTDHTQHHPSHIMKEQTSHGQTHTQPNMNTPTDHTQHHPYPHIVKEQTSYGGQTHTQPNMNTRTVPSQYPATQIMVKAVSLVSGNHIITGQKRQYPSPDTLEKPASSNKVPVSCKDPKDTKTLITQNIPASHNKKRKILKNTVESSGSPENLQTNGDDEKNSSSSVYSVRQSDNAMEILYHCPSCQKGFYSNLDLARHQVTHTVDKLFICSLCGKSFTELSFLIKHQVIHTDLKLCVCQVCGRCFYSETSLAKHQKSHSLPVHCTTCGKCFFSKAELEIHNRKHTGERPYGCLVCGKQFLNKPDFDQHKLCHSKVELSK